MGGRLGTLCHLGTLWGSGYTGVPMPFGDISGCWEGWGHRATRGHLGVLGTLCHWGAPWGARCPPTGEQTQALGPPHPVPPPSGGALTVSPQKPSAICARLELCPGEPGGVLAVPPHLGAPSVLPQVGAAGGICGVSVGGIWGHPYRVLYGHLGASIGYLGASTGASTQGLYGHLWGHRWGIWGHPYRLLYGLLGGHLSGHLHRFLYGHLGPSTRASMG